MMNLYQLFYGDGDVGDDDGAVPDNSMDHHQTDGDFIGGYTCEEDETGYTISQERYSMRGFPETAATRNSTQMQRRRATPRFPHNYHPHHYGKSVCMACV